MNMGLKIEGGQMEAGFTVSSREEFDECVEKLTTMAGTLWPLDPGAQMSIGDDETRVVTVAQGGSYAEQRRSASQWREAQGLR